ncbi:hypothetical protein GOV04_04040 [Candidatus Woesearchaeota archaeon]|nr:hypothetical protein [Candidatus Woesearchaeota archaeon]
MAEQNVLVLCAHSDDQVLGAGGTIAKYASEGKKVYTIILSYGELALWWFKKSVGATIRVKEAQAADKVLGGSGATFFGLTEGKFAQGIKQKNVLSNIKKFMTKNNINQIITHSIDDPLPDHNETYKLAVKIADSSKKNVGVYSFDVWNIWNIRKRDVPRLYVDITNTFEKKIKALDCFESQKVWIYFTHLYWSMLIRAKVFGWQNKTKHAERFYKIR